MVRIFAVSLLVIPGIISAIGIKLMRDTLFDDLHPFFFNFCVQFGVGSILFIVGITFITGFIVHRDRKKNLVERQKNKKRRSEEHTSELQSRFDIVCRLLLEKKKFN